MTITLWKAKAHGANIDVWHDWVWPWGLALCNWLNWTLLAVDWEWSAQTGQAELHLAFLGVHARPSFWVRTARSAAFLSEMEDRYKKWTSDHPLESDDN